MKNCRPYC